MHLQSVIILCSAALVAGKAVKFEDDGRYKYKPSKYVIFNSGKYDRPANEGKYIPGDEGKYTYIYKQYVDHIEKYMHMMGPGDGKYNSAIEKYLTQDESDLINSVSPPCSCDSRTSSFNGLQYLPPIINTKVQVGANYTITDAPHVRDALKQSDNVHSAENIDDKYGDMVLVYSERKHSSATHSKRPDLQTTSSTEKTYSETSSASVPLSLDSELPLQNRNHLLDQYLSSDEIENDEIIETRHEIAETLREIEFAESNTHTESQSSSEDSSTVQAVEWNPYEQTTIETDSESNLSTAASSTFVQTETELKSPLVHQSASADRVTTSSDTDSNHKVDVGSGAGLKKFKVIKIVVFISTTDEE